MFIQISQLEIENIRKEVNIKLSVIEKYNKTLLQMEERVDQKLKEANMRIQNSINTVKELKHTDDSRHQHNKKRRWVPRDAYIHNYKTHYNGVAVMRTEENKIVRIPLICKWIYNYKSRRWIPQYKVSSLEKTEDFRDFYHNHKTRIIHGTANIKDTLRELNRIKTQNIIKYRKTLRSRLNSNETEEMEI